MRTRLLAALLAFAAAPFARADSLVLGGGCFWCVEASFEILPGVTAVTSGYAGGFVENPTYRQVTREHTGHAEVVKIDYDPARITLEKLLAHFWIAHDPTQVGGQGADLGPQYRSIILYADDAQKAAAGKSRDEAAKRRAKPITTEIVPLTQFWPAEDYHQDYFAKNPSAAYCSVVIKPKVDKLRKTLDAAPRAGTLQPERGGTRPPGAFSAA